MTTLIPEWSPQAATLLSWPHFNSDWNRTGNRDRSDVDKKQPELARDKLDQAEQCYSGIVSTITGFQPVIVVCRDEAHRQHISDLPAIKSLLNTERIRFACIPCDDTWIRDYGPLSINADNTVEYHNFQFNAWGGKYPFELDNAVTDKLVQAGDLLPAKVVNHDLVLEGGAIESNGKGMLLMHRNCVVNENRNPGLGQIEIERRMKRLLGAHQFLWLEDLVLEGDDTDGHIDNFARFCSDNMICYVRCNNPDDPHYPVLKEMELQLQSLNSGLESPCDLIALPLPSPVYNQEGERLPASYANFLIGNRFVLVPQFDVPEDKIAFELLARCFPGRTAVGIDSRILVHEGGGIHCATMQLARPK